MRTESTVTTMENLRVIPITDGPITVAFRKDGPYWIATALEFDIMGTGPTRQDALSQLQELVNLYLIEVLTAAGTHSVFNPSEAADWENADKEKFSIHMIIHVKKKQGAASARRMNFNEVRPFRREIREFNLTPVSMQ